MSIFLVWMYLTGSKTPAIVLYPLLILVPLVSVVLLEFALHFF